MRKSIAIGAASALACVSAIVERMGCRQLALPAQRCLIRRFPLLRSRSVGVVGYARRDSCCSGLLNVYIGGAVPRPTFTLGACSVPSGCLTAAETKMWAPGVSSLLSPGT